MDLLEQHIEGLIFVAEGPITIKEIKNALDAVAPKPIEKKEILTCIDKILEKYKNEAYAFELTEISGGLQFLTKPAVHASVSSYLRQISKKRLSKAALETLAIIAYKQPVTKSEVEQIRGVSCDYSIQKLLEKELVSIEGRSPGPGRPLLYGTSPKFMDYFGLNDLSDMPKLKDFKVTENTVGEPAPIEELSNGESIEETSDESE